MVVWKEIKGYENYHIFEDGRVWSCIGKGKFLKCYGDNNGYLTIRLNGKMKKHHRLVGEAFIPNPENKPQIDHIDRNRTNNHISNLRWATRQENMDNIGEYKNNTTGHKNVSYNKSKNRWLFKRTIHGVLIEKTFKTKTDALCYKYIFLLKQKSNLI